MAQLADSACMDPRPELSLESLGTPYLRYLCIPYFCHEVGTPYGTYNALPNRDETSCELVGAGMSSTVYVPTGMYVLVRARRATNYLQSLSNQCRVRRGSDRFLSQAQGCPIRATSDRTMYIMMYRPRYRPHDRPINPSPFPST